MKKIYMFTLLLLLLSSIGWSQAVLQTESFESATIFPAPGWRVQRAVTNVNAGFLLQIAGTATNPSPGSSPGGGVNIMMLNSFVASLNDTAYMISKPFDFSNNGGVDPFIRFYMYRDNGFLANEDKIRVYINTVPTITGATLLTNTVGTNEILRRNNGAPVAVANTWNQYTYNLPAATYNGKRYYVILEGVCRDGNNIYIDQINLSGTVLTTGISEIEKSMELVIYPNPTASTANVDFNLEPNKSVKINLVDIMGRVLEETTKTANNDGRISHTINQRGNLASGIYFVNIDVDNQRISKKVIIE